MQPDASGVDRWSPAYEAHRRTVHALARQHFGKIPNMRIEDLEQEILEVLWKACETYDPNHGSKFNTWFRMLVRNRVGHLLQYAFAQKRQSDLHVETLSDEAVEWAVERATAAWSAEDEAMAYFTVIEHRESERID